MKKLFYYPSKNLEHQRLPMEQNTLNTDYDSLQTEMKGMKFESSQQVMQKKPREIIAKVDYVNTYYLKQGHGQDDDAIGFYPHEWRDQSGKVWSDYGMSKSLVDAEGGKVGDKAIKFNNVRKLGKPFTLESLGIKRTPQKFQYYNKPSILDELNSTMVVDLGDI